MKKTTRKKHRLPTIVRDLRPASRKTYKSLHSQFLREIKQQDALYSIEVQNKKLSKRTYFETIAHNLALLAVWHAEGK